MDISRRKSLSNYKEEFQTREAFNDEMAFLKGSELTVSRCDPSGGWLITQDQFRRVSYNVLPDVSGLNFTNCNHSKNQCSINFPM